MRCRCCGEIGKWTIPARNGVGCVCEPCYTLINAPLRCPEENLINLCRAVIATASLDFLYLRRYELTGEKFSERWRREIEKNGIIAKGFFGDLMGDFSMYCSIANLIPEEAKERLKCLTLEKINDILGELGK